MTTAPVNALTEETKTFDHVILHVGRHKCASTFLQRVFFPQLTRHFCMEKNQIFEILRSKDFVPDRFRQFVLSNIRPSHKKKCLNLDRNDLLILSREGLSHYPGAMQYARNLKVAYPNARVILIIREQFDLLKTLYTWHTCRKFLRDSPDSYFENLMNSNEVEYLLHNKVIRAYMDVFGERNVLVLPYELLKSDAEGFLHRIVDFVDPTLKYTLKQTPLNISYKKRAVIRGVIAFNYLILFFFLLPRKLLNRLGFARESPVLQRVEFRLKKFNRKKLSALLNRVFRNGPDLALEPGHFEKYATRFAAVNDEIEAVTGLDLGAFGYVTGKNIDSFLQQRRR